MGRSAGPPSHPKSPPWSLRTDQSHVQGEVLKERPDVVTGVDLLHLHLRVYVAVVHEVHVRHFNLGSGHRRGTF